MFGEFQANNFRVSTLKQKMNTFTPPSSSSSSTTTTSTSTSTSSSTSTTPTSSSSSVKFSKTGSVSHLV